MKKKIKQKKIGIALGSGSARGLAHIGVLKALDEEEIPIDFIAGTSVGALVGAVYASGNIQSFEEFVRKITWKTIVTYLDVVLPRNGLITGKRIHKLLGDYFSDQPIELLQIPLCCVAVDIGTGQEIRFQSGRIVDAVRASISIPGIFTPHKYQDTYFVDGGIANPLPIDVVFQMGADIVIAVDLNQDRLANGIILKEEQEEMNSPQKQAIETKGNKNVQLFQILEEKFKAIKGSIEDKVNTLVNRKSPPNIFDIIGNTIYIIQNKITQANITISTPDFLIQPEVGSIKLFDFDQAEFGINEGYQKTKEIIPLIKQSISE